MVEYDNCNDYNLLRKDTSVNYSKVEAPPVAINLITSLRNMGYTLSTSIADLVDNSIYAGATQIELRFDWVRGKASFMLLDNGCGMSAESLLNAMTFSSSHVSMKRATDDLGRFGLGLKSASLSQCRVLKVFSKEENAVAAGLIWDLNELEKSLGEKWMLIKPDDAYIKACSTEIKGSGTLVVWEDMDVFYRSGVCEKDFLDQIDLVEKYLSITFHRYLEEKLIIIINGKKVTPDDPMKNIKSVYTSPTENIGSFHKPVKLKAFAYSKSDALKKYAGNYYVYRSSRLLCQGKISGLVRTLGDNINLVIDINNSLDIEWNIDIIKSRSNIPRKHLAEIKRFIGWIDKKLVIPKKKKDTFESFDDNDLWVVDKTKRRININRGNPAISQFKKSLPSDLIQGFNNILGELEKTAPVKIEYYYSEGIQDIKSGENYSKLSPEAEKEIIIQLLRLVKIKKMPLKKAVERLKNNELFLQFGDAIDSVATRLVNSDD